MSVSSSLHTPSSHEEVKQSAAHEVASSPCEHIPSPHMAQSATHVDIVSPSEQTPSPHMAQSAAHEVTSSPSPHIPSPQEPEGAQSWAHEASFSSVAQTPSPHDPNVAQSAAHEVPSSPSSQIESPHTAASCAQSDAHEATLSPSSQTPSPHSSGGVVVTAQSRAQFWAVSVSSQIPLPHPSSSGVSGSSESSPAHPHKKRDAVTKREERAKVRFAQWPAIRREGFTTQTSSLKGEIDSEQMSTALATRFFIQRVTGRIQGGAFLPIIFPTFATERVERPGSFLYLSAYDQERMSCTLSLPLFPKEKRDGPLLSSRIRPHRSSIPMTPPVNVPPSKTHRPHRGKARIARSLPRSGTPSLSQPRRRLSPLSCSQRGDASCHR